MTYVDNFVKIQLTNKLITYKNPYRKEVKIINKYIGIYRVFPTILTNGELSPNREDTYLLGKHKIQVYRWNKNTLCVYFTSNQTVNNILPQLQEKGVQLELYLQGDTESVYKVKESDIHRLHEVIRFQIKGKNIQAKSNKTVRKLQKKQLNK